VWGREWREKKRETRCFGGPTRRDAWPEKKSACNNSYYFEEKGREKRSHVFFILRRKEGKKTAELAPLYHLIIFMQGGKRGRLPFTPP